MDSRASRWIAIGITFVLFGAVDLLVLLVTPGPQHGWVLVPPVVAGVAVLVTLPYVLALFERQQERIERQLREIDTLHAMDTAIVSEMELDRVLDVAVLRILRAADAEAAGIILIDSETGETTAEAFSFPSHEGDDAERFCRVVRSGGRPDMLWEALTEPLDTTRGVKGYIGAGRYRPCQPYLPVDRTLMSALSVTVSVAVANARALRAARETTQVRADLERERRVAAALTEGLLPDIAPRVGCWIFSKRYQAQSNEAQVGGDIYDLFPLGEGRWGVVIADVSGKGLAAARKTAMVKYSLRSYAREHTSPAKVLSRLNDALSDDEDMTGFVTLLYGVLDEQSGRFHYASAGHEPPLIRRADGTFEALPPTGMVLGAMRDMPYETNEAELCVGDGLLLYTDGLTEARERDTDEFLMLDGVETMLKRLGSVSGEKMADALLAEVEVYTGGRLLDDTALVWIECAAAVSGPGLGG